MKRWGIPLPPQYNTGPFIGQLLFLYGSGMGLFGIATNAIGLGAYYVILTGRWPGLSAVPVWLFYLLLFVLFTLLMVFAYSVVTPSRIEFSNVQNYMHNNPVIKKLESMDDRLKAIEELLKKE